MVEQNRSMAKRLGFPSVPAEKQAVAVAIARYVERGGFLFAMCTATETLDLALAADGVDIAAAYADGSPMDTGATAAMRWDRALAFQGARLEMSPTIPGAVCPGASRTASVNVRTDAATTAPKITSTKSS